MPAAMNSTLMANNYRRQRDEMEDLRSRIMAENVLLTPDEERLAQNVIREIGRAFSEEFSSASMDGDTRTRIETRIGELCAKSAPDDAETALRIQKAVTDTAFGLGPITPYMADPTIEEIIVQRWNNVVVIQSGVAKPVSVTFSSEAHLQTIIQRIMQAAEQPFDMTHPFADAQLGDGSRVHATHPRITPAGATLAIRKFTAAKMTPEDYIRQKCVPGIAMQILQRFVEARINIIVFGGTSTGKTMFLNVLSGFIPPNELIVTIEDTRELQLRTKNVRSMIVSNIGTGMHTITMKDLVKAALRQRPDRIIVGEARDDAIVDAIDAFGTGHEGSMLTAHATTAQDLCNNRIPTLYEKGGRTYSERFVARQIADSVDVIVGLRRLRSGRRVVSSLSAIEGLSADKMTVNVMDLIVYNEAEDMFTTTGNVPHRLLDKLNERGYGVNENLFSRVRRLP